MIQRVSRRQFLHGCAFSLCNLEWSQVSFGITTLRLEGLLQKWTGAPPSTRPWSYKVGVETASWCLTPDTPETAQHPLHIGREMESHRAHSRLALIIIILSGCASQIQKRARIADEPCKSCPPFWRRRNSTKRLRQRWLSCSVAFSSTWKCVILRFFYVFSFLFFVYVFNFVFDSFPSKFQKYSLISFLCIWFSFPS